MHLLKGGILTLQTINFVYLYKQLIKIISYSVAPEQRELSPYSKLNFFFYYYKKICKQYILLADMFWDLTKYLSINVYFNTVSSVKHLCSFEPLFLQQCVCLIHSLGSLKTSPLECWLYSLLKFSQSLITHKVW